MPDIQWCCWNMVSLKVEETLLCSLHLIKFCRVFFYTLLLVPPHFYHMSCFVHSVLALIALCFSFVWIQLSLALNVQKIFSVFCAGPLVSLWCHLVPVLSVSLLSACADFPCLQWVWSSALEMSHFAHLTLVPLYLFSFKLHLQCTQFFRDGMFYSKRRQITSLSRRFSWPMIQPCIWPNI